MGVNEEAVRAELAHVEVALKAAWRWTDVGLGASRRDPRDWEDANYFSRVLLTRGLDAMLRLGHQLRVEASDPQSQYAAEQHRQMRSFWSEGADALERAHQGLTSLNGASHDDTLVRRAFFDVREALNRGMHRVGELRTLLGPEVAHDLEVTRPNRLSVVRDHDERGFG